MKLSLAYTTKALLRNIPRKAKLFLPALLLVFLLVPQLVQAQGSQTIISRHISDFLSLWIGGDNPQPQDIKDGKASGILVPGLAKDGYDKEGVVKKIKTVISLNIDNTKHYRAWNMVGANFRNRVGALENKKYLRLFDESFLVRVYQKDKTSGAIINESIAFPKNCSFISCDNNDIQSIAGTYAGLQLGKPLDRIVKFASGAAAFNQAYVPYFTDRKSDGYQADGSGWGVNRVIGTVVGFVAGGGVGAVAGNLGGTVVNFVKTAGVILTLQQTAVVDIPINSSLNKGEETYVELWYLGSDRYDRSDSGFKPAGTANNEVPVNPQPEGSRIKYFNDIEISKNNGDWFSGTYSGKEYPYFQIGGTYVFKTPTSFEEAAALANTAETEVSSIQSNLKTDEVSSTLPICSILPWGEGSVMGCVAQILYHAIFRPVAFFAQLMGKLFDYFMYYSLSDESYRHEFIQTGWQLVRDISNIFFILVMVWSGLVAVFNTSNVSYKKVVPTLIINALIINFSLFATRVVIDISNITARIFYNQMVVKIGGEEGKLGSAGEKQISAAIVSSFNPQSIFQNMVLESENSSTANGNNAGQKTDFNANQTQNIANGSKFERGSREYAGYFSLVTLVAIFISFGVGMMFWKTAFIFIGRVIGLYVAMIFSPFAFLSRGGVPLVSKIDSINYNSWWGDLINYASLAPIFVFFLYIINSFLNVEFFNKLGLDKNSNDFFTSVMHVMIPMLIIYGLVTKAVGIAQKHAGEFGKMAQKFAVNTTKIAGAVALGGTAMVGRTAMSGLSKGFGTWAAANKDKNILASGANRFLQWGQKSSLDIRNTKAFNALSNLGIKTDDKVASAIGLGQRDALGGNVKAREEREKKKMKETEEKNDMSHLTTEQVKQVWAKMSEREARERAERVWEAQKTTSPEIDALKNEAKELNKKLETAVAAKDSVAEKSLKEQLAANAKSQADTMAPLVTAMLEEKKGNAHHKTKDYIDALDKAKIDIKSEYGKVESAKDLSAVMRYQYAQRMLEESLLLSNGEKRWRLAPGGGGILGSLGFALGPLGGIVGGGVVANYIDDQQEAAKNTYNKIIKDFKKAHNPEKNRLLKLNKELEDIDNLIFNHVDDLLGEIGKAEALKKAGKEDELEEHFAKARTRAQRMTDDAKYDYDEALKRYRAKEKSKRTKADEDDLNDLANAHRKARDTSDALNRAKEDKRWTESEIAKEEEKAKNAEDKKKGGGGKEDKPKDEK